MHACKSGFMTMTYIQTGERSLDLSCSDIGPAHNAVVPVTQEIALGDTLAQEQCSECTGTGLAKEPVQLQIRDYVHVVYQETAFRRPQQAFRITDSAPGVTQQVGFVRIADIQPREFRISRHVLPDFICKVMDIDYEFITSRSTEPHKYVIQKGMPGHRGKRFREIVRQRLEPGSKPSCKNHCLHLSEILFYIEFPVGN